MAVVVGNLALLLDLTSPRTVVPDRKTRPATLDAVLNLNLPKRDLHAHGNAFIAAKVFDSEGEGRSQRVVARGKSNSKMNGVDYEAESSDEEGNGNGNGYDEEEEEAFDWEKEMRRRLKEIEEKRELEKKAEELRGQMEDGEGDGREETEEEKRMRVRKELEKVKFFSFFFFFELVVVNYINCKWDLFFW